MWQLLRYLFVENELFHDLLKLRLQGERIMSQLDDALAGQQALLAQIAALGQQIAKTHADLLAEIEALKDQAVDTSKLSALLEAQAEAAAALEALSAQEEAADPDQPEEAPAEEPEAPAEEPQQ